MNKACSKIDVKQLMQRADMINFMNRRSDIKKTIISAFSKADINPHEEAVGWLSRWGWWISDEFLFQDTEAHRLTKAVSNAAMNLYTALSEARHHSKIDDTDEDSDANSKINTCLNMLQYTSDADEMAANVLTIAMRAEEALRVGLVHKKGQPPLIAYYAFVRDFYEVFRTSANAVGYYKTSNGAEGSFVDVIECAQEILPEKMRLSVRSTIGNRVLAALRESNPALG
ncbi:hypothetical protein GOFOIKOB_2987 [Methylobacterium tardum]|uniref:Uncharacterized protein n=1 Tax=Methylobacterium tardum TaxID=374432 RepID=A0AA37WTJ6_9HYPH|nr:hypothetical protein GOFOIKOB_2987 [Methylobacterium tardum]GLS70153.1 hypothetical protein GCM10007890_21660 [Methylobacterium tardum]